MNNMNNRNSQCCGNNQFERVRNQNCGGNNIMSSTPRNECGCRRDMGCNADSSKQKDAFCGMPIGIGYVPWQRWGDIYGPADALNAGTIFPALNLPFCGCVPRSCNKSRGGAL